MKPSGLISRPTTRPRYVPIQNCKIARVTHAPRRNCQAYNEAGMRIQLVTNPLTDGDFRITAERMLSEDGLSPEGLQSHLRSEYPHASVVRGIEDSGSVRWYAYRDGHWVGAKAG